MDCPDSLSGAHVYAIRGPRNKGYFRCICGATTTRREHFILEQRREHHRILCPCRGTLRGCDYYQAERHAQWAERRVLIFEHRLQDARAVYDAALRALRGAEADLQREQADYRERLQAFEAIQQVI